MARKQSNRGRWKLPVSLAALIALVVGAYFGILWAGERSRQAIAERDRYKVKFDDLECDTPPGMERAEFLTEVRYLTNAPTEWSTADAEMPKKLAELFRKHPWVKNAVPKAEAMLWPKPVTLEFRKPFLAVKTDDGDRVVDDAGILLPRNIQTKSITHFQTRQESPTTGAGELWVNADIRRAVQIAKDHDTQTIEKTAQGWRITLRNGKPLRLP